LKSVGIATIQMGNCTESGASILQLHFFIYLAPSNYERDISTSA